MVTCIHPTLRLSGHMLSCERCTYLPSTGFIWGRGDDPAYQGVEAYAELVGNSQDAGETRIRNFAFLNHVHRIFAHANTARQFGLRHATLCTFLSYPFSESHS